MVIDDPKHWAYHVETAFCFILGIWGLSTIIYTFSQNAFFSIMMAADTFALVIFLALIKLESKSNKKPPNQGEVFVKGYQDKW